jgi:hypothetical protein
MWRINAQSMNRPRYDTGCGRPSFVPASPFQLGPRRRCPQLPPQSLSSSPVRAMGAWLGDVPGGLGALVAMGECTVY